MFNLVKYRFIFLLVSGIIIIPGLISLAIFHLNVGLDFAGGADVELHPQTTLQVTQLRTMLKSLNLVDLNIVTGNNDKLPGNKTVWIPLSTRIDTNVQSTITTDLQNKYGTSVNVKTYDLRLSDKMVTLIVANGFTTVPQVSDIKTLLAKLPDTSDPAKGPPSSPAATPTPAATTPTGNGTPTAGTTPAASPTAKAGVTPTVAATAAVPATPVVVKGTPIVTTQTNPSNIPVSVTDVTTGTTTQTISILTRSSVQATSISSGNAQGKGTDVPTLMATILKNGGPYVELVSNSEVGAAVAAQTTLYAFLAVLVASAAILCYVWFSFRKVARPWRYGTCAIIALLHDVLVVLGVFSILGRLFNIQIDALFLTALLTIVGFSVHDTIVVFDRIRENMQRRTSETFDQVVNASLVQTMARSLNTSLTVLFTLSALTLFGGESIRVFTLTLLVGIFSGTYSSIFNASMLLVIWEKGEMGFGYLNRKRTPDGRPVRELVSTR